MELAGRRIVDAAAVCRSVAVGHAVALGDVEVLNSDLARAAHLDVAADGAQRCLRTRNDDAADRLQTVALGRVRPPDQGDVLVGDRQMLVRVVAAAVEAAVVEYDLCTRGATRSSDSVLDRAVVA